MKGLLEAFILESLGQEAKHGYALLKDMEECFGQEPNRNKIYPLLQRMEKADLIRKVPGDEEEGRGRTRYELTDAGERELEAYRRIPEPFRRTVGRLWSRGGRGPDPAAPAPEPEAESEKAAPATQERPAAPQTASESRAPTTLTPQETGMPAADPARPTTPSEGDHAPYPCPDARVGLEKDPRTGDLGIRLTGCPMGAYDYCPLCPVQKAVVGLRDLVFGVRGRAP